MVKRRNPLHRRIIREIFGDLGKYLTIFILMIAMIGLASGYFVAIGSMIKGYDNSFELYNIENGSFVSRNEIRKSKKRAIEESGNIIYPIFYKDISIDNNRIVRIYTNRREVNKVCVMDGELPSTQGEIAIDRTFANNNGYTIGDSFFSNNQTYKIVGLVALSDYSALFSDNTDSMFDAIMFGVAIVCEDDYKLEDSEEIYRYAWKYPSEPDSEKVEKELADEFASLLRKNIILDSFTPRYLNQAIMFAGDDLGRDSSMIHLFLYIMLIMMAFVSALTTADTITKEAGVIGTLRASGYTKREIVVHYLMAPLLVIIVACIIGNILGYTWLKQIMRDLYYNSYSLPTYPTLFNASAFLETTIAPVVIMLVISFIVLIRKLSFSPLKFLRRDLSKKKQKRSLKLPHRLSFFMRYRLRVIIQNIPNYITLWVGLLLANVLLLFGLGMPETIKNYQNTIADDLLATKQYILTVPASLETDSHAVTDLIAMMEFANAVETKTEGAEKFSVYQVETYEAAKQEDVLVYGVMKNSKYIHQEMEEGEVYISTACANKYRAKVGDVIKVKEYYEDKVYEFTISGIYPYDSAVTIFMDQSYMNKVFDLGDDYFSGYFSNVEIDDIDEEYIGSVIDAESLTKVSRQLDVSFGGFMKALRVATFVIFFTMMYLLTKIIIEKNAQSISMTKILGYTSNEVRKLYIRATTIVVIVEMLLCLPISNWVNRWMIEGYMSARMTGFLPYYASNDLFIKMLAVGFLAYGIVVLFEIIKIYRIPKTDALKNAD